MPACLHPCPCPRPRSLPRSPLSAWSTNNIISHISKMTSLVNAPGFFIPHPVLDSIDLLTVILSQYDARKTLVHAAVVRRAWTEPALRLLWRTVLGWGDRPLHLYHILLCQDQIVKIGSSARGTSRQYISCKEILIWSVHL